DIKDKDGNPTTLIGIIDRGNNNGFLLNSNTANRLGLTAGAADTANTLGGEVPVMTTSIPESNAGTIRNAEQSGTFNVPVQGEGRIIAEIPDDQINLGSDFLNPDPAGKGAHLFNEARETGTGTVWNHEQALRLSSLPVSTPMVLVAVGTIN